MQQLHCFMQLLVLTSRRGLQTASVICAANNIPKRARKRLTTLAIGCIHASAQGGFDMKVAFKASNQVCSLLWPKSKREQERLQCFSKPTSAASQYRDRLRRFFQMIALQNVVALRWCVSWVWVEFSDADRPVSDTKHDVYLVHAQALDEAKR